MIEVLALPYPDYKVLERWTQEELNNPSKSDLYVMQLTQLLHTVNSKKTYQIEDFKLKFGKAEKPKPMTQEQKNRAIELSQSRWKARVGAKTVKVEVVDPARIEMKETL